MHKIAPAWKWLLVVILALLAIAAAFYFDDAVRAWISAHPNRTTRQVMRNVSRYGDWPAHVAAGLIVMALAFLRKNKRWVQIALTMILACALAGIAARGIKIAAGRARPALKQELGWHGPRLSSKYNSFPSGHTAATTAFFGVLLFANRRLAFALAPIPLLIAVSRLYVGAHYFSDVVAAMVLGLFCAWLCARWRPPPLGHP